VGDEGEGGILTDGLSVLVRLVLGRRAGVLAVVGKLVERIVSGDGVLLSSSNQ